MSPETDECKTRPTALIFCRSQSVQKLEFLLIGGRNSIHLLGNCYKSANLPQNKPQKSHIKTKGIWALVALVCPYAISRFEEFAEQDGYFPHKDFDM